MVPKIYQNLRGRQLEAAVDTLLRKVNLFSGGVGDKRCGQYSGGMKRRLSVAIALIGDPLVVYLDEPSTGLDPASRRNLWQVVQEAKRDRAVVLTTHSMEEASMLCDRVGIFVDGALQCLGAPKELTARLGGFFVFTLTTPPEQEAQAAAAVAAAFPTSRRTYALAGTQKHELPAADVRLADVFAAVASLRASHGLDVQDWSFTAASLEDVFFAVLRSGGDQINDDVINVGL